MALAAPPAAAWRLTSPTEGEGIAVGPDGSVALAAWHLGHFGTEAYDLQLLSAAGRRRWRFRGVFGRAHAIAFATGGNVVVAGSIAEAFQPTSFAAIAVDGRRGAERWRFLLPEGTARSIAATADGDVLVGGVSQQQFTVVRLDGATGAPRWTWQISRPATATDIAVDATGECVAGGTDVVLRLAADGSRRWHGYFPELVRGVALAADGDVAFVTRDGLAARRLASADGAERWRATVADGFTLGAVAFDAAGDVVVGGRARVSDEAGYFLVAKLDGASGAERWRRTVGGPGEQDIAVDLALDAAGDVAVAGTVSVAGKGRRFGVVRLAGDTGAVRMQRSIDGRETEGDTDRGVAVVVDGRGRVVALGSIAAGLFESRAVLLRLPRR